MDLVIAHLDMDAYFASVEQRDNPRLKGKPVIVGTGARAVVTAASYEARPFGVSAGMPVAEARRLCPQAVFLPGSYEKYAKTSSEIFAFLNQFSPTVDPASIDEGFLDMSGCQSLFGPPLEHARKIQQAVEKNFQLSCSLGIGPNRLVAKMASGFKKPKGLTYFATEQLAAAAFNPLPVEKLIGVGPKMKEHLNRIGIRTIGDLASFPTPLLEKSFGVATHGLARAAQGYAEGAWWGGSRERRKSLSHAMTFEKDTKDPEFLSKILLLLAEQVSRRLREEHIVARKITLTLRFSDFKTLTRNGPLPSPTLDPFVIHEAALKLLKAEPLPKPLRLLGIATHGLKDEQDTEQLGLFDTGTKQKKPLLQAMDKLREKYGEEIVGWASLHNPSNSLEKKNPRLSLLTSFTKPKKTS